MKKTTLTLAISLCFGSLFAQEKDFFAKMFVLYTQDRDIEKKEKSIEKIKTEIDKLAAEPKSQNNAEVWVWKSAMDAEFASSDNLKAKCADCLATSFDAFKKYEALENSLKLLAEAPFNWRPLGILYEKYYEIGKGFYAEKNWNNAFENFDKSAHFGKIIMRKNIRKNDGALDTLSILMTAYAAQNAQKTKEALAYYSIAADAKYGSMADIDLYKYLLIGYSDAKDKNNFEKYYATAVAKYPNENFEDYKLDFISKNLSLDEKVAMFDAEDAKGTLTGNAYMNFGDMLVNYKKEDREALEKNPAKKAALQAKAREAFKKAYQKSNDVLAGFNVGVLYFNEYNDLDDAYRANVKAMQEINAAKAAEKDPKKKVAADAKAKADVDAIKKTNADIDTKMNTTVEMAIEWLDKTEVALKTKADKSKTEKTSYKNSVKFLGGLYEYKRDKVKGKDPKAYDTFDAKSKQYFDLYDKS